MPRRSLPDTIQAYVRWRAGYLCEYCHTLEQWQYIPFTIDHVLPIAQSGTDSPENLALACFHCNRRKGSHTTAVDRETSEEVPLYNPRQHQWQDHFMWSSDGLHVLGLTTIGRATVEKLELNRPRVVRLRAADIIVKRHPPKGDPRQTA